MNNRDILTYNRLKESIYVFLFLSILLAIIVPDFYPKIFTHVPDGGDSLHNIWTWRDNINRIFDGNRAWTDTNIYWPAKNTIAFQEYQLANTLVFLPVFRFNVVLAHNIVLFCCIIITGVFTYLISRELKCSVLISLLVAILFAFLPSRIAHVFHTQSISFQFVLMPLYFLMRYLNAGGSKFLILYLIFLTIHMSSIGYLAFFSGIINFAVLALGLAFAADGYRKRTLRVFAFLIFVAILVSPLWFQYYKSASLGFKRHIGEITYFGVDLAFFFTAPQYSILYADYTSDLRAIRHDGAISAVFPGVIGSILILIGLLSSFYYFFKRKPKIEMRVFSVLTLLFLLMCLGPDIRLFNEKIITNYFFTFLLEHCESLYAFRYTTAYFWPFSFFALSLGGSFVDSLLNFSKRSVVLCVSIILAIAIFELREKDLMLYLLKKGDEIPGGYLWLKERPYLPVLELPISVSDPGEFLSMYYSGYHQKPILNGHSGFFPDEYTRSLAFASRLPELDSLMFFKNLGVGYIVLRKSLGLNYTNNFLKELMLKPNFEDDYAYYIELGTQ